MPQNPAGWEPRRPASGTRHPGPREAAASHHEAAPRWQPGLGNRRSVGPGAGRPPPGSGPGAEMPCGARAWAWGGIDTPRPWARLQMAKKGANSGVWRFLAAPGRGFRDRHRGADRRALDVQEERHHRRASRVSPGDRPHAHFPDRERTAPPQRRIQTRGPAPGPATGSPGRTRHVPCRSAGAMWRRGGGGDRSQERAR